MQANYNNISAELKDQINTLTSKVNQPTEAANPLSGQQSTNQVTQQLLATPIPVSTTPSAPAASTKSYPDRKFNVVLFGLAECPKGTKKFSRDKSDQNNATAIFSELDNSIQPFSIRDAVRLGKYNPTGRPRSLLVTFNRSSDVTTILSNRTQIKSPYTVKADLSKQARAIESHLLKARWSLIQANIPKTDIKIRGNKLYVKDNYMAKLTAQDLNLILSLITRALQSLLLLLPLWTLLPQQVPPRPDSTYSGPKSVCKTAGAW